MNAYTFLLTASIVVGVPAIALCSYMIREAFINILEGE